MGNPLPGSEWPPPHLPRSRCPHTPRPVPCACAAVSRVTGMPKYFTFKELQLMYEAVLGRPFDQTNFGRRVMELDIIEAIDPESDAAKETVARTVMRGHAGRRPQVWRLKHKKLVTFDKTKF